MRFYTQQHKVYCGIDLQARSMYLGVLNEEGDTLLHRNMKSDPALFLTIIAPYREDLVVVVECIGTGYGLADLGAKGSPLSWGMRSRKAIPGGRPSMTRSRRKIAVLVRGGMIPLSPRAAFHPRPAPTPHASDA